LVLTIILRIDVRLSIINGTFAPELNKNPNYHLPALDASDM